MQAVIVAGWPGPSRYIFAVKRKLLAPLATESCAYSVSTSREGGIR
jgi:hypothetical protein